MTSNKIILLSVVFLFITACEPVCPPDAVTTIVPPFPAYEPLADNPSTTPIEVEIKGKLREVDRVIHGPLCNDTWQGVIYIACDVQVAAWEEDPIFLRACNLNIEENTVVYVASHNDAQFNKGCSCHE